MLAHIAEGTGAGAGAVVLVRIIWLIAFALDDARRWRRFLFLVFLLTAAATAAGWWLLGDGGLQVILHDFGPASITHPAAASRHVAGTASGQRRTTAFG